MTLDAGGRTGLGWTYSSTAAAHVIREHLAGVVHDRNAFDIAGDVYDVRALLPVVDCLQLDATRCGGYTGWLRGAALAQAHNVQVSDVHSGMMRLSDHAPGHGMSLSKQAHEWCVA